MHVLFVSPTFPPENGWGGIGTYVHHISIMLANAGNRVTVLCGQGESRIDYVRNGVQVCRHLRLSSTDQIEASVQVAEEINNIVSERDVDVVEFAEFGANGVIFQRNNRSFPVVVRLHGDSMLCRLANGPRWKRAALSSINLVRPFQLDRFERESASLAHVVTAPSHWVVEQCQRRNWTFRQPPVIFANAYNVTEVERIGSLKNAQAKVLHLARLDYRKGADFLGQIMNRVWSVIPEAKFELVGQDEGRKNGRWQDSIRKDIPSRFNEQLTIRGGVPYEKIPALIAENSVAFFCSVWENYPYTLVECMAEGLPCINGSGGGASEVGVDGESVINAERRPDLIAQAIIRVLNDSSLRKTLSHNARTRIKNVCGESSVVAKALDVYNNAIRLASTSRGVGNHSRLAVR